MTRPSPKSPQGVRASSKSTQPQCTKGKAVGSLQLLGFCVPCPRSWRRNPGAAQRRAPLSRFHQINFQQRLVPFIPVTSQHRVKRSSFLVVSLLHPSSLTETSGDRPCHDIRFQATEGQGHLAAPLQDPKSPGCQRTQAEASGCPTDVGAPQHLSLLTGCPRPTPWVG